MARTLNLLDAFVSVLQRRGACLLVGAVLLAPLSAFAQQEASIVGVVTDESGGVLPGVTVTARSPALQVPSVTGVTNERGAYRLTPLPIGVYAVTYELSGFQTVRRDDIRLNTGFVATVNVSISVGTVQETVTVTGGSPIVDVVSTAPATRLTRETLDILPTSRNGTVSIMGQAPGARPNLDVGGDSVASPPQFRAFGQANQPWQQIEGVLVSAAKSGTQGGIYWDYTNVEEAKVGTFGSPAEIGTRGIALNGILKSGGNNFSGNGFFGFQDRAFQSNNIDAFLNSQGITRGDQLDSRTDTSGDLGGRIVRDKVWFYVGARRRTSQSETLQCFQPNGDPCYSTDRQIFNTQKVSWQMTDSQRLVGFHTYARRRAMGSGSRLVAWESRLGQTLPSHVGKVEWQAVKGNSMVVNVMAGDMRWTSAFRGYGYGKVLKTDLVLGTTTGMSGTDGEDPIDYNHQARGSVSWYRPDLFLGNHDIKVGGEFMRRRSDRLRISRGETWQVAQQINRGEVPERYDSGNYQLQFRNGVANRLIVFNYPAEPIDLEDYTSAYLQDSWRTGRLTLNLGVRYAHDNGFAPEQCRVAADPPGDVVNPARCWPKVQMKIFDSFVPRLHAAYDLTADGKTVVKGGWGRFMLMRYTDQTQIANHNQANLSTYVWRDLNNNGEYEAGEVNLDPNGPDYLSTAQAGIGGGGTTSLGVPNPNEKQPGTDEFSLSLEREVMANFAVRVSGIYSKTFDTHRLINNKRPYDVFNIPVTGADPGPDGVIGTRDDTGRTITYYDFPAEYAGAQFQQPMLVNDSSANQSYKSGEIALTRRLANRWHMYASYSYTKKRIPFVPNAGTQTGVTIYVNTLDPNAEINNDDNTGEWVGRVQGSYIFPFDITASAGYEHRSGDPQRRTVILTGGRQIPQITLPAENFGEVWRLPNINLVDLNVQRTFRFARGQSAVLRMNVFNLLNANTMTGRTMQSGPAFGTITGILLPRIGEVAVSYRF
jgi:hypothetical protein